MDTSSGPTAQEQELAITPLILITGSTAAIFAVDMLLPRGVALPMLYVIPILLSVHCRQRWFRVSIAVACTVLTVAGYVFTESAVPTWIAVTNRALAFAVIWITAVLAWQRMQAREHVNVLRDLLPMCASCHKVRDDKGYWSQVEEYLEAHTQTMLTHGICPACMQKWYPDFYPQVAEQHPDLFRDTLAEPHEERHSGAGKRERP
jgi:K+-sensing histidine kinase KdpD